MGRPVRTGEGWGRAAEFLTPRSVMPVRHPSKHNRQVMGTQGEGEVVVTDTDSGSQRPKDWMTSVRSHSRSAMEPQLSFSLLEGSISTP